MKRAAKKDLNHNEIKKALQKVGCFVFDTHQLKNAFDCLVLFRGITYVVEIKNITVKKYASMSKEDKREYLINSLTDGEKKCMGDFEKVGVRYYIITSINEALEMINVK